MIDRFMQWTFESLLQKSKSRKYAKIYGLLIYRAKNRPNLKSPVEEHHIIPHRCKFNGPDDADNLVRLTPEEHYLAHLLLVKMFPDNNGLVMAANFMLTEHQGRENNKAYGWIRRRLSEKLSELSKGTVWINDGVKSLMIRSTDPIPDGWQKGRPRTLKEKVSRSLEGKSLTKKHRMAIAMGQKGPKHSDETKAKISQSRSGKIWITDGKSLTFVPATDPIPIGWRKGRK